MSELVEIEKERITLNKLFRYFLKGLLVVAPITITIYIIFAALNWIDGLIPNLKIPGLGIIIVISSITLAGMVASRFLSKRMVEYGEKYLIKIPLIGLIYSSLKELIAAFVGEQKKFSQPVVVNMDNQGVLQRLGFITQQDLSNLGIEDRVAVYFPHSYNFSGNFFLVPKGNVKPINVSSTHYMKFIVSGGMTAIPKGAFDPQAQETTPGN